MHDDQKHTKENSLKFDLFILMLEGVIMLFLLQLKERENATGIGFSYLSIYLSLVHFKIT